jgi:hypothetical protein
MQVVSKQNEKISIHCTSFYFQLCRRTSAWLASKKSIPLQWIIKTLNNAPAHYASTKAKAIATANTLHAVTHCVSRLAEFPSDEPAAEVAIPGPGSVGRKMRPEDVEASDPAPDCWRRIVLPCKTSPAAIG